MIDRDNMPKWEPPKLKDVTNVKVERYFSDLGPSELKL